MPQFQLDELAEDLHLIEDEKEISLSLLNNFYAKFKRALLQIDSKLLTCFADTSTHQSFTVSEEQLDHLQQDVVRLLPAGRIQTQLCGEIALLRTVPFSDVVGDIRSTSQRIARQLGKKVLIELTGETMPIPYPMIPLCQSLIHAIRNAIDHGIELPRERGSKSEQGRVLIDVKFEASNSR